MSFVIKPLLSDQAIFLPRTNPSCAWLSAKICLARTRGYLGPLVLQISVVEFECGQSEAGKKRTVNDDELEYGGIKLESLLGNNEIFEFLCNRGGGTKETWSVRREKEWATAFLSLGLRLPRHLLSCFGHYLYPRLANVNALFFKDPGFPVIPLNDLFEFCLKTGSRGTRTRVEV